MAEFIKELSGHSGCKLALYKEKSYFYVQKSSQSENYNQRLKKQFIKQKKFCSPVVRKPQVFGYGSDNGLFHFDMEFLNCKTFAEYISTMNPAEIEGYINLLFNTLPINEDCMTQNSPSLFLKKIKELDEKIEIKTEVEERAFNLCLQWKWMNIPKSYCHGDLTLENVLITTSNQIYLIDFLDSFCNSWMIDVAKLLQDLEIKWSYRKDKADMNRDIRLLIAKESLLNHLRVYPKGQEYLRNIYYVLLLNLLRILPYTKDVETKQFLQGAMDKTIQIINQEVL